TGDLLPPQTPVPGQARGNQIHADSMREDGLGHRAHKPNQPMLGRRVRYRSHSMMIAAAGADINDAPPFLSYHVWQRGLGRIEGLDQVEKNIVFERTRIMIERIEQCAVMDGSTGVVDQDVKATKLI